MIPLPERPLAIALYQPDIPQNTGTIVRMAACFKVPVIIIEPAGFPVSDRAFRRAGMDYLDMAEIVRMPSWDSFLDARERQGGRIILATTRGEHAHVDVSYLSGDILLFGRETLGVPDPVHDAADLRVRIPIHAGTRSLNLAVSAAILTAEALRQLGGFPAKAGP